MRRVREVDRPSSSPSQDHHAVLNRAGLANVWMAAPLNDEPSTSERTLTLPGSRLGSRTARVSAHVIWDYIVSPVARNLEDVPPRPEALSEEWLTAVLCAAVPNAQVIDFVILGGHEGTSVRRQLAVTYNAAGERACLPGLLYSKSTPTLSRRIGRLAQTEVAFYRQVRPELDDIEVPVCYHACSDDDSGRSLILLEDLVATKRARFCTLTTRISRSQAEAVVDTLATFHGRYHASPRLDADLSSVRHAHEYLGESLLFRMKRYHDEAMIRAEAVIPEDVTRQSHKLHPLAMKSLEIHGHHPRTLLHRDVHLGNWYITGDGRMGLCDWQCMSQGHWARDLAYAISTTLTVEDRRAWERDLISRYLDGMRERCLLDASFERAWTYYRQQLFAALLMWTPTLVRPPGVPDMQPVEMSLEMIRRITTAISDLDAMDSHTDAPH